MSAVSIEGAPPVSAPPRPVLFVGVETLEERRLVTQFLCLLRAARENTMIAVLRERTGFRWWANGQPAGVTRTE